MYHRSETSLNARELRVALAVSQYHRDITESMSNAAIEEFARSGGSRDSLVIVPAPGSFELTAICRELAMGSQYGVARSPDAIVAIGCILTGETAHDQYIAQSVTQGLTAITVQTGVPIAFGVLTCQSLEQAQARSVRAAAAGSVNKGAEAMQAAIATANTIRSLRSPGVSS